MSTFAESVSKQGDTSPSVNNDDEPDESKPDDRKFTIKYAHYVHHFQTWDPEKNKYLPWDPHTSNSTGDCWFCVTTRDDFRKLKPTVVVSDFSKPLLRFLRTSVRGDSGFFDETPFYTVKDLFPRLTELENRLNEAKSLLSAHKQEVDLAQSLGIPGAHAINSGDLTKQIKEVVDHVGAFLEYLRGEFKPVEERFTLEKKDGFISFDLLIYYFKPNDHLCYSQKHGEFEQPRALVVTRTEYVSSGDYSMRHRPISSERLFRIEGYFIIWTGKSYWQETRKIEIEEFKDVKDLSHLPVTHLDEETKDKLATRGRKFVTLASEAVHYKFYRESRVMVDHAAYTEYVDRNPYSRVPYSPPPDTPTRSNPTVNLKEEELHLLPEHVCGYNLSNQRWETFLVDEIRDPVFDRNAWDHLVLNNGVKTMIRALVEATRNDVTSNMMSDVISGKGGGLVALLHGPPGSGKTLTAEAVAESLERPLYMVGSSEMSHTPSNLEENLRRILKLASVWDAVLLIDEADVFLEKRSLNELYRNSLVSVALRMLEYHRGVLFLTTNRIKSFDEAFYSRFSIAISYPELDEEGRFAVWSAFIKLAGGQVVDDSRDGVSLSKSDLRELASKPFNGRIIKNVVRTSKALAIAWGESLNRTHIDQVVETQEKFLQDFEQSTAASKLAHDIRTQVAGREDVITDYPDPVTLLQVDQKKVDEKMIHKAFISNALMDQLGFYILFFLLPFLILSMWGVGRQAA
ncbi:P-loop containing nucleoside triphosphate hydrolase protein [Dendrothele bispora CBS 962.96]|uniref:P-loop containing nucleoside triphosphate hydrolase protein n=1 Tax=Dendrothele bispora (strain CBS 962.96) TaxID=1314807 RepID=A0A4S8LKV9_DENBC|nr:P-loop containing nucleoside triphosphate hydrolase protein [Dendrothele bispora CBS 962.96]